MLFYFFLTMAPLFNCKMKILERGDKSNTKYLARKRMSEIATCWLSPSALGIQLLKQQYIVYLEWKRWEDHEVCTEF